MKRIAIVFLLLTINIAYAHTTSYPNGAKKAVIFSYDDGVVQDRKLVKLFNQYQVVGTFNLSSGLFGQRAPWMHTFIGKAGQYINAEEVNTLYKGHEVAGHSYSHPSLAGLENTELARQIDNDKQILSELTGYEVTSFAYPLGSYDNSAKTALGQAGFSNARTVEDSGSFDIPSDFLQWRPTVHHSHAMPLVRQYLKSQPDKLTVLMIWGHSWELDENKPNNNWDYMHTLLEKISGQNDIWYVSAGDFANFIKAKQIKGR